MFPDANSKHFKREQVQLISSINTNFNPNITFNNCDFTDSNVEKLLNYDCDHWGANTKVMDIINKKRKIRRPFG